MFIFIFYILPFLSYIDDVVDLERINVSQTFRSLCEILWSSLALVHELKAFIVLHKIGKFFLFVLWEFKLTVRTIIR